METNANQKVSCVANYAYDASEADELSIRPGDVLRDVERLPGGWWRGELRGRRGMFPDNFVSVLTEQANARSGGVQGRCRAVFSYQPANPDELPLSVGDVLEVLGEVEEGWWQGRRQGRVGVFPSNFVVMLDPPQPAPPFEPAPALPPKPVKEQCRVLFPYTAVNDDELTLAEGDIVTIVSKDAPDRGWWRGELLGRQGLFPDNFVQMLPAAKRRPLLDKAQGFPQRPVLRRSHPGTSRTMAAEAEEKKPDRPPSKTNAIYPVLNKYSEKTASVKELTTSKISLHKENTISKESTTQSTVTHTNKTESEKLIHNESVNDGTLDGQIKKPPVPLKKSPTPSAGVGGLFSGLKTKMLSSTDKEKSSSTTVSSGSSSGGEWDRPDGAVASRPPSNTLDHVERNSMLNDPRAHSRNKDDVAIADRPDGAAASRPPSNTLDHVERNSMLNDPRAHRVKAPRRRPPSQALRDDTPQQIGLSNGHEVPTEREKPPTEKAEEIKPRAREWEKHKAPWMEELKLNQAKKTSFGADGKSRSVSTGSESGVASKAGGGSTDRILECGLEEKRSTHSMEMSKSTSSISSRMSVLESFEETKVRHSLDSKKELNSNREDPIPAAKPTLLHSPTAAGRTLLNMLDEIKKPQAPPPPVASTRPPPEPADKSPNAKTEKIISNSEKIVATSEKLTENIISRSSGIFEKSNTLERIEKIEEKIPEKPNKTADKSASGTLERRLHSLKAEKVEPAKQDKVEKIEKSEGTEALIAQLNSRISNLEKIIEVQNSMFTAAVEELSAKLQAEADKRQALQAEVAKLAHCVTQV